MEGNDLIRGKKIIQVRPMTVEEQNAEDWDERATVLVLENGVRLYASQDEEGNGAGAMFGRLPNGKSIYVFAQEEI